MRHGHLRIEDGFFYGIYGAVSTIKRSIPGKMISGIYTIRRR
jgi:hypothetical protein